MRRSPHPRSRTRPGRLTRAVLACTVLALAASMTAACGSSSSSSSCHKSKSKSKSKSRKSSATCSHPKSGSTGSGAKRNKSFFVQLTGYDSLGSALEYRVLRAASTTSGSAPANYRADTKDTVEHSLRHRSTLSVHPAPGQKCTPDSKGNDLCTKDGLIAGLKDGTKVLAKIYTNRNSQVYRVDELNGTVTGL